MPAENVHVQTHWSSLPRSLQNLIWRYYEQGQESDWGKVSDDYLYASQMVVEWLAEKEGVPHGAMSETWAGTCTGECQTLVNALIHSQRLALGESDE